MKENSITNQRGSITLMMVFFTMIVMFLFVFTNNITATREKVLARNDIATEKAFYSAQACIEEGYLQLRTDENYPGASINVDGVECDVVAQHNAGQTSGKLIGTGRSANSIRTVASYYADAGASSVRNNTTIYHILDRSGSMDDDGNGCTIAGLNNPTDCTNNGGVWGPQPMIFAREAAKSFISEMDSVYDKIGVVHYDDVAGCDFTASSDLVAASIAVDAVPNPDGGYTNIGDAIALATSNIINYAPGTDTKVEIVMTDGVTNRPNNIAYAEQYALDQANIADNSGILIFAIGLGSSVNEDFLRNDIATDPSMYFYAPSPEDLEDIYSQIANIILSYNISQNGWIEE